MEMITNENEILKLTNLKQIKENKLFAFYQNDYGTAAIYRDRERELLKKNQLRLDKLKRIEIRKNEKNNR